MGILVNKDFEEKDELSRSISADLKERMEETQKDADKKKDPDLVEDSEYAKDFSKTSKYAWVWVVLGVIAVAGLVAFGITSGQK